MLIFKEVKTKVQLYSVRILSQREKIQSNAINTDTEGAIESVRIKLIEFREDVRARDKDSCP